MPNPDSLPTPNDPGGPCPRCGRTSNFTQAGQIALKTATGPAMAGGGVATRQLQRATALNCMGCKDSTIVIESRATPSDSFHPVLWWPIPGAGQLDPSVPSTVGSAYDEGVRCLAVEAPHAAVAMLRTALAQVVLDKGSTAAQIKVKTNLAAGIDQWLKDGLHAELGDWAAQTRMVGNAGAHQEAYQPISMSEAEELRELVNQFIVITYVIPAQLAQARAGGTGAKRP